MSQLMHIQIPYKVQQVQESDNIVGKALLKFMTKDLMLHHTFTTIGHKHNNSLTVVNYHNRVCLCHICSGVQTEAE